MILKKEIVEKTMNKFNLSEIAQKEFEKYKKDVQRDLQKYIQEEKERRAKTTAKSKTMIIG